jgi:Tfp pilus assembly protein PilV
MTPTGRIPPPAEDGFVLIEVLASALVLAIASVGVMALLQATTHSAAAERHHSEAYGLAQEDQARLRSMRLSALNRLEQNREVSLDGTQFTVKSNGVFVNNTTGQPSSCTTGTTSADYVRITSTVSWYDSHNPVVIQSIVSPSDGSLDPNHGTLVITTKNAAGEPLAGVGLSGTGEGSFSGTTDSTGCANFTDLPAGNYQVTPTAPGLVGHDGQPPHTETTSVIAGGTNTLALQYDAGATLPVEFEYRVGSGSEFKHANIDSVYIFNSLGAAAYWTPTKAREERVTAKPIFPFTSPVSVWAGSCGSNNPGTGAGQGSITLSPGQTVVTPMKLKVPAYELTVDNGSSPIKGAKVTVTDESCTESSGHRIERSYLTEKSGHQSSSSEGKAEYGLPYGTYEVCASASISGTNRRMITRGVSVHSFTSSKAETFNLANAEKATC